MKAFLDHVPIIKVIRCTLTKTPTDQFLSTVTSFIPWQQRVTSKQPPYVCSSLSWVLSDSKPHIVVRFSRTIFNSSIVFVFFHKDEVNLRQAGRQRLDTMRSNFRFLLRMLRLKLPLSARRDISEHEKTKMGGGDLVSFLLEIQQLFLLL